MRICLCFALALLACGKGSTDAPVKVGSGSGSGSGSAVAVGGMQLVINDKVIATYAANDVAAWPRLDALVPQDAKRMGQWEKLTISGKGAPLEIPKPGDLYRDQALALFVADGAPAFGIFDPVELAKKGQPTVRKDGVTKIEIKVNTEGGRGQNESGSGGGGDPLQIKVTFKTPGKAETTVTGAQLLAIPREVVPGTTDSKGWKLTTLLTLGGLAKFDKVIVSDVNGDNLAIEHKDFDDVNVIPFLKLNKQGTLRLRIFKKQGTGWQATGDIRAVGSVELVK